MSLNTVYTKTAKGVLDVKSKAVRLTRELGLLFLAIDGKSTIAELASKTGIAENKLREALDKMAADGHIKAIETASAASAGSGKPPAVADDLDFTSPETVAKLNAEAETRMKAEAHAKARALEAARIAAEAKARQETEARARAMAEAKLKDEAQAKAKAEAEAQAASDARAKAEQEASVAANAQAKAAAEARVRAATEAKAKAEAEARLRATAEALAKQEAAAKTVGEAKAREEAEARARAETEARAHAEAETRARSALEAQIKAMSEALAQAEARARQEAEARVRMEAENKARAEAEARARADAEARAAVAEAAVSKAQAMAQAAAKARAEAEAERKARAEAEQRAKSEAVARILKEKELQDKADSEVQQRVADELKARELAEREKDARYRAEATERARASAENQKKRMDEEVSSAAELPSPRKPANRARNAAIAIAVLIAAAAGLLQFVPLTGLISGVQQVMEQRLQQPVAIAEMRYALFPTPHLRLERVAIGKLQEIKIGSIVAHTLPLTLFAEVKDFDSIEVNSLTMDQNALAMLPGWVKPATGATRLRVGKINVIAARVETKSLEVPVFNADIALERNGTLKKALLSDGRLRIDFSPGDHGWRVNATASNWRLPFGPQAEFDHLTLTAFIDGQKADIKGIEGNIGRGTITGSASASWGADIRMSGDVSLANGDLGKLLGVFTRDFSAAGTVSLTATYALQAASLTALFDQPQVEVNFNAEKGTLNNIDLVRSIQSPSRDGTHGGKTSFNDLAGSLQVQGKGYAYRQLQLSSGPMSATGSLDVAPNGELSGRINAELGTKSVIVARGTLNVSGSVKSPLLKP